MEENVIEKLRHFNGERGIEVHPSGQGFAFYPVGLTHKGKTKQAHIDVKDGAVDVIHHMNHIHSTTSSRSMVESNLDQHQDPFGSKCEEMFKFTLRHEPENEYDSNALRVIAEIPTKILESYTYDRQHMMTKVVDFGWVPKEINGIILAHLSDLALDRIHIVKIKQCWGSVWACKLAVPLKAAVKEQNNSIEETLWLGWVDE